MYPERVQSQRIKFMPAVMYSHRVKEAIGQDHPLVALETAVITHGLPYPQNLETALKMEEIILAGGAVPATIGMLNGRLHLGLTTEQLTELARKDDPIKISRRDFGAAFLHKSSGGTTVAGTLTALEAAPIKVFATGGIGGVHRGEGFDVSADLPTLANTKAVVVCSGAKSILDLPATLEILETLSVPVVGFRTDEFPAFYARSSGLPVKIRVEDEDEAARLADHHWSLGLESAVLLVVPPPVEDALSDREMKEAVDQALEEASQQEIRGNQVTPFLLSRISEISGGRSLQANLGLLKNNAGVAARTAAALQKLG